MRDRSENLSHFLWFVRSSIKQWHSLVHYISHIPLSLSLFAFLSLHTHSIATPFQSSPRSMIHTHISLCLSHPTPLSINSRPPLVSLPHNHPFPLFLLSFETNNKNNKKNILKFFSLIAIPISLLYKILSLTPLWLSLKYFIHLEVGDSIQKKKKKKKKKKKNQIF
jgi:hypothetical protein